MRRDRGYRHASPIAKVSPAVHWIGIMLCKYDSRTGGIKQSFKATNDETHDSNKYATNNFDDSTTIIAQFMIEM
eukprot:scaffold3750_cov111-Skeletonema_dohrnii-CCMP3373.AAC.3